MSIDFGMVFLFVLAIIFVIVAVIQDLKKREIANWLNFSLIFFALGFRFFYSLFQDSWSFFYQGVFGLAIFFVLGSLLYYSRFFAGGDAKLFIALGATLSTSLNFKENLAIFLVFFIIFFVVGAAYSIAASLYLSLKNLKSFKKEFKRQFLNNRNLIYSGFLIGLTMMITGLIVGKLLFYLGILFFVFSYLYVYAKAVDESCMIRKIKTKELAEGDWLYQDVKVGKNFVKAKWDGLNSKEISKLKKSHKYVLIRYGIPFSPTFLITIVIVFYFVINGLWNSFW